MDTPLDLIDDPDGPFLRLDVRLEDGRRFAAGAAPGYHVMELIRAQGLPIKAECGGAGVCATCHVRVAPEWQPHLPDPTKEEMERLDAIPSADDSSRLACQIVMRAELDGLTLELASDSFDADKEGTHA